MVFNKLSGVGSTITYQYPSLHELAFENVIISVNNVVYTFTILFNSCQMWELTYFKHGKIDLLVLWEV